MYLVLPSRISFIGIAIGCRSALGQCFFKNSSACLSTSSSYIYGTRFWLRLTEEIMTAPGTMLINPDVHFMYNIGTANNTMIHECVHWDRHRRPFELQKLLQGECSHITCEIVEKYEGMKEDESAVKWMEWQASQLAPRILMPREMTI